MHTRNIISVKFHATGETYYFGSLAAIYTMFSHEEIGLRLSTLHLKGVSRAPYDTGKCIISKHKLYTKKNEQTKQEINMREV
jgi:hypothetical protein